MEMLRPLALSVSAPDRFRNRHLEVPLDNQGAVSIYAQQAVYTAILWQLLFMRSQLHVTAMWSCCRFVTKEFYELSQHGSLGNFCYGFKTPRENGTWEENT